MKPIILILLLSGFAVGTTTNTLAVEDDAAVSVLQLVRDSEQAMADDQIDQAIRLARQATEHDPAWAPGWRQYGIALLRGESATDAVSAFRRAIDLEAEDATAWRGLAQALWRDHRRNDAVNALSVYLRLTPRNATAWRDMAIWKTLLDHPEQAIAALKRVVDLKPDDADAWRDLGNLRLRQGQRLEAVEAFTRALAIRPVDPPVQRDLGWVLWALDRRDEAIKQLALAVQHNVGKRDQVVIQVVARLSEEGAVDDALDFYRRTHPDTPISDIALTLARRGRLQAAEPLLAAAWEDGHQPDSTGLYLAYVRAVNGRTEDVQRYLEPFVDRIETASESDMDLALETLRLTSANPEVPRLITRLETAIGDRTLFDVRITDILEKAADDQRFRQGPDQALTLYRRVLERDPDRLSWITAYRLSATLEPHETTSRWLDDLAGRATLPAVQIGIKGIQAHHRNDPTSALNRLSESLALEPDQPVLRQYMFDNHLKLGQAAAARQQAEWFDQRVTDGETHLRADLALLWTRLGEPERALPHWQLLHLSAPDQLYYGIENALALFRLGHADAAVQLLREMLEDQPETRIYEWLAEIAAVRDDPQQVAEWAENGLRQSPSPALLRYRAESRERLGDYRESLDAALAYLAHDPGYSQMALLAGVALQAIDQEADARAHYRALLERNPSLLPALSALRDDAIRRKAFDEALDFARERLRLQPADPEAQRLHANAQAQNDQFRPALKTLRRNARKPVNTAVPVLVYRSPFDVPYPGRNTVAQIADHIEVLSQAGYRFIQTDAERETYAGEPRVMIILLDPSPRAVEALDPVLKAHDARVLYAGHPGLPPRNPPGLPVPDRLRPLFESGRWKLASSGPATAYRGPIDLDGRLGNILVQPMLTADGRLESTAVFEARRDHLLADAARFLADEPERLLIYPGGDFGQRALDIRQPEPAALQTAVAEVYQVDPSNAWEPLARFHEAVAAHFTHAVYIDDSGFWLPDTDPLRIPARVVPPQWNNETLARHLTQEHPLVRARLELGRVLYWHGQYESAVRAFERAAAEGANPSEIAFNRGMTAERQGDIPTALSHLRQARTLNPADERVDAAIERAENQRRPQAHAFLRGWEDNEDRSLTQYGITGDLFLGERVRLGATLDRNHWDTEELGSETGLRGGLRGRIFLMPQMWLSAHIWRLALDDLLDRWGGEAALRLTTPGLNGTATPFVRREEIETVEALRETIDARLVGLRTYTRILDRFDLFADLTRNLRTDGNDTDMFEGRLVYRIKEWPYAGLGWRFRFADSDHNPPAYWAPDELEQHQLHVNLRGSRERLRGSLSGDAGYARERETDWRFVWGLRAEGELQLDRRLSLNGEVFWFEGPIYERLTWRAGLTGRF